jgi:hypothetical protein
MKTIIAGSRSIVSLDAIREAIKASGFDVSCVVSGRAPGVDTLGEVWAKENNVVVDPYPAKWDDINHPDARVKVNKFGKKYDAYAGLRRNKLMAENAEALIAIWDGVSPGTKNMIANAKALGLKVFVYRV